MKTVLITGCNGFIGRKLTDYLLKKGIRVIGLDISEQCINNSELFTFMTLVFSSSLIESLKRFEIDVLYHLAWSGVSSTDKNNPDKQFLNIGLTYKVLELANALRVKKIIIPGSMSEFSKCSTPVSGYEEDSPSDLYAATKVAIRKIAYQYCEKNNLDLNWLLLTSVYGTDRKDSNLITTCIDSLKAGVPFECTKLEQIWDYIHIQDVLYAFFLIGEQGEKNAIYPVGSGESHPLNYYVNYIAKKMNKELLLKVGYIDYKTSFIDNSVPNIERLSKLGFVHKMSFESFLDSLLSYKPDE